MWSRSQAGGGSGPSTHGQPPFSTVPSTSVIRSISSYLPKPTSPIQSSLVPGRKVVRYGLRRP